MIQNDGQQAEKHSVRHFLKRWGWWVVPIVLFASFYIWEARFTHNPPYAFPFSVLRIGQIAGLISALLLGVWWLKTFRRGPFLGRSSPGMFGIGLAATILNSITDQIPFIISITVGLQVLWLVFVWVHDRHDPFLVEWKTASRRLRPVRKDLFGSGLVWIEIVNCRLASILLFVSMTGLGYGQLLHYRQEFSAYGPMTMILSISLFPIAIGLTTSRPSLQHLEMRMLGNPPHSRSETIRLIFSEIDNLKMGCLCLGIVSFAAIVGAILSRSDSRFVKLYLCTAGVFAIAPSLCLMYGLLLCKQMVHAVLDGGFGRILENLRNLYRDHTVLIRSEFDFPIPFRAKETTEGIQVEDLIGPRIYPWESVRHLWMHSAIIRLVLETNNTIVGPLKLTGKQNKVRRESIFRLWGDKSCSNNLTEFIHPERYRIRDTWYNQTEPWGCILIGIIVPGFFASVLFFGKADSPVEYYVCGGIFLAFSLAALMLAGYGVYRLIHKIHVLDRISIQDRMIRVQFIDGTDVEFGASDLIKIEFSNEPYGYHMYVKNIPVIRNIDKVSYFGVLKNRLDAMMAQQEQLKSVEDRQ